MQIVKEDELVHAKYLLKLKLISDKIPFKSFAECLFIQYTEKENISIRELIKLLYDMPTKGSELLARYLIESRETAEIEYNQNAECSVTEVIGKLKQFLCIDYDVEPKLLEETKNKLLKVMKINADKCIENRGEVVRHKSVFEQKREKAQRNRFTDLA